MPTNLMKKTTGFAILVSLASLPFAINNIEAQSTLEYSTLVSGVASATATQEKNANSTADKLYSASADILSKSGDLLSKAGGAAPNAEKPQVSTETTPKENNIAKKQVAPGKKEESTKKIASTKIFLKDGTIVEGKLIGYINNAIQIDVAGATITYFNDDIRRIEEYS